jgi:hypothetical protein
VDVVEPVAGDTDDDGDLDLFVVQFGLANQLIRNDGPGGFADGDPDIYFGGHDLFAGANHVMLLNQGGVQGGSLGDFTRVNWFDPVDFITSDVELLDMDADGDLEIVQLGAGVVSGNPVNGFKVYLFENSTL